MPDRQSATRELCYLRTKETQELSNLIGGELKIGPEGFTLEVEIKVP